jgi:pimeloyl-ACP methyl ester carboxylesterase
VLALAIGLVVIRVLEKNYRSALSDFRPAPISRLSKYPVETGIAELSDISFLTTGGLKIQGWYVPSKNHAAVIVVAGANVDRSFLLPEIRILSGAGFGVLSFDWPGSGASEGEVHWGKNEREALVAAIDWIGARSDVDPQKIGGFGHSMGGYVMAQVTAVDLRINAAILAAAPPSYEEYIRWGHRQWGVLSEFPARYAVKQSRMPLDELVPKDVVRLISPRPLLILGGSLDPEVPQFMTEELYHSANDPKSLWIIEGATHTGYSEVSPQYPNRLIDFFNRTLLLQK